jgi:hypothetical protein
LGVPLKDGAGSFNARGTLPAEAALASSRAWEEQITPSDTNAATGALILDMSCVTRGAEKSVFIVCNYLIIVTTTRPV